MIKPAMSVFRSWRKLIIAITVLMGISGLLFLCLTLLQPNVAHGQTEPVVTPTPTPDPTSWQKISYARSWGVPIWSIVVDCNNPDRIYMGTDVGLFRSNDKGTTWGTLSDQAGSGPPSEALKSATWSIVVSCQEPSTIFVGTNTGLLRSKTTGSTWELLEIASGVPITTSVQTVAVDLTNPLVAYIGTWGYGVYKTTNGGDNWLTINEGLTSLDIHEIIIDPRRSDTLYVGTSSDGVFKSTNGGHNWAQASNGLPLPSMCYQLAADFLEPDTLYASIARVENDRWIGLGMYKSTDGGISWSPASNGLPAGAVVDTIVVDPTTQGTLYVGTYGGGVYNGIYRSKDSGRSWVYVSEGLPHGAWLPAIGIDSKPPHTLYAGTGSGELFVSNDSGISWTGLVSGLPENLQVNSIVIEAEAGRSIYLGTTQGVFKSTDSGLTWVSANTGISNADISSIAVQPTKPSIVYAGTYGGQIYRSRDNGRNWTLTWSGSDRAHINDFLISRSKPIIVYAALETGTLLRSDDDGESWYEIDLGVGRAPVRSVVEDMYMADILYATTWGTGVLKSTDGGETWFSANKGLESPFATVVSSDPHTPGTLYTHIDRWGIFKTVDYGETWSRVGSGIPIAETVSTLVVDTVLTNTLYVGTVRGIYMSDDGGDTWLPATEGLPEDTPVTTIAIDLSAPGNIYVGTSSRGLFRGDVIRIAKAPQPVNVYWDMQSILELVDRVLGLLPYQASIVLIVTLGILAIWLMRRIFRGIISEWITILFRPSKLFKRVRERHLTVSNGVWIYIVCTLGGLVILSLVFYGPFSDTTGREGTSQLWQVPHLRMQMDRPLAHSVLIRLRIDTLMSEQNWPLISYITISSVIFFGLMILALLLFFGTAWVLDDTEASYEKTFTGLLYVTAFVNMTSVFASAVLACSHSLNSAEVGLTVSTLFALWALALGIVATRDIHRLSLRQSVTAWILAPFSPVVVVWDLVSFLGTEIVHLPWRHALSLLMGMLRNPQATIKEIRSAPFLKVGDAKPYLVVYALSFAPFWLPLLCARILGLQVPVAISRLLGFYKYDIWSIWIALFVLVSLVELSAQWLNHKGHPIWRNKPSEVHRWGTLLRGFFLINAAVDVAIRAVFCLSCLLLAIVFNSNVAVSGILPALFEQIRMLWKVALGLLAIMLTYDTVRWKQHLALLERHLREWLSVKSLKGLTRICAIVLRKPGQIANIAKARGALEKSLLLFASSAVLSLLSAIVASVFDAFYGARIAILSRTTPLRLWSELSDGVPPIWPWSQLSDNASLLLFLIIMAGGISYYAGIMTKQQSDTTDRRAKQKTGFESPFSDYAPILAGLLSIVGTISIVGSGVYIGLSSLGLSTYRIAVSVFTFAWQMILATLASSRLARRPVWQMLLVIVLTGVAILAVQYYGALFWGFAVLGILVIRQDLDIPSNPLSYVLEREDLRAIKTTADAYLHEVARPRKARSLYLEVLRLSEVLRDPDPTVRRILKELLDSSSAAATLLPRRFRLLPIYQDIASTLVHLSSINVQDSLDYIDASIVTDDSSLNWERKKECREAALGELANMVATDNTLIFENIASLIDAGVAPRTFEQIAQYFPDGLLSAIYLTYKDLLAYEEAREREEYEDQMISIAAKPFSDVPRVIRNAASVFAEARSLRHGEEVFLVYDLLSRSIEARFVRDLVAINLDYSQLTLIKNSPVFPDVIAVLSNLSQVTELLVRSEKADFADKLPYYARMVEILDRMGEVMSTKRLLGIEKDIITLVIVPHWKTLLLDRIRELKGRSSLHVALAEPSMLRRQGDIMLLIKNEGNGIAENIRVQVDTNQSNIELSPTSQVVDSIPPRAGMQLAFQTDPIAKAEMYRVAFNILYDDLERSDKVVAFADAVVIERREREFRRLESIPYVAGPPLRTPEMFVGRDDIFDYVLENLQAESQDNIILLHGERRTGKTSILYQMRQKLDQQYVPVYVDLQGMLDPGPAAFLHDIALRVYDVLEEEGIQLPKPELAAFEGSPGFYFRDVFLNDVAHRLGQRRLVLMIDEFEVLEDRVNSGKLDKDIFEYLRNLMQHSNVSFIFAGTYDVTKIAKDYLSVLFNIALPKKIEPLNRLETDKLVQEPVAGYFEYDGFALDKIWQVTAGHPFFVQLLCRELIRYGNRHEISYFTVQDVSNTIGKLIEAGDIHLGYIWDGLSHEKRILLVVLGNLLQTKGIAISSEIQAMLRRYDVSLNLDESLRELWARGIIQEHEGRYSFKIGLISEWVNATRRIESLLQ